MEKTAQYKVGDKLMYGDGGWYGEGTVVTVLAVDSADTHMPYYVTNGEDEYWVEPDNLTLKQTKNQRITALEETVEQLKARVEQLGALVEAKQSPPITVKSEADITKVANTLAKLHRGETVVPVKTANQKRKAIIDEAKAFVAEHTKPNSSNEEWRKRGGINWEYFSVIPEFHVNMEKRVVTLLLRGASPYDGKIKAKFFAKCAPDDVFNADIGKAIALGRALGLDVARFEQAVKPTELVVGQSIRYSNNESLTGAIRKVSKVTETRLTFSNEKTFTAALRPYINDYIGYAFNIIDDTGAEY